MISGLCACAILASSGQSTSTECTSSKALGVRSPALAVSISGWTPPASAQRSTVRARWHDAIWHGPLIPRSMWCYQSPCEETRVTLPTFQWTDLFAPASLVVVAVVARVLRACFTNTRLGPRSRPFHRGPCKWMAAHTFHIAQGACLFNSCLERLHTIQATTARVNGCAGPSKRAAQASMSRQHRRFATRTEPNKLATRPRTSQQAKQAIKLAASKRSF